MVSLPDKCSKCGSTKSKTFWDYEDGKVLCDDCETKTNQKLKRKQKSKFGRAKAFAKNEIMRAVDKDISKVYLFSKDNVMVIETYPGYYKWVLMAGLFIICLFFGFILGFLGLLFAYWISKAILAKTSGEPRELELMGLSVKQLKEKEPEIINWSDISKAQIKRSEFNNSGNIVIYFGGQAQKLIVRSNKDEAIKLLKLKLQSKLTIIEK